MDLTYTCMYGRGRILRPWHKVNIEEETSPLDMKLLVRAQQNDMTLREKVQVDKGKTTVVDFTER